jgi:hypothetical protein
VVIYQGERPIHATFPEILAESAQEALDEHFPGVVEGSSVDVAFNPLLPWIAAGGSGYTLPLSAAPLVASAMDRIQSPVLIVQAGEVWHHAVRPDTISWDRMLNLLAFVRAVIEGTEDSGEELWPKYQKHFL